MPWKDDTVETQRQSFCHRIVHGKQPVAAVCREIGLSRKTAYKWLARYQADPQTPLSDRSKRPVSSPKRSDEAIEARVLALREQYGWGGRKIQRLMSAATNDAKDDTPSIRTVSAILKRHGCTQDRAPDTPAAAPMYFERSKPNDMWQIDHKGPCEIARRRHYPLTVLDDHSRFCFCFEPLTDKSINLYWPVLWGIFGEFGLPEAILCDNAFSAKGLGLSEFDMRLIRLGIRPAHGRSYHPQTQGKVERVHRTVEQELLAFKARLDQMDLFVEDRDRWKHVYNHIRPHESLGDLPPISRWEMSPRKRPDHLPPIVYDSGAELRKVSQVGDIQFKGTRIGVARCLIGQHVRIEERDLEIGVFYGWKELRTIPLETLAKSRRNQRI